MRKCIAKIGNTYGILVRKLEEKRLLGRPRYRWEDSTKIYGRAKGYEGYSLTQCFSMGGPQVD
jgi:hypothetical protein